MKNKDGKRKKKLGNPLNTFQYDTYLCTVIFQSRHIHTHICKVGPSRTTNLSIADSLGIHAQVRGKMSLCLAMIGEILANLASQAPKAKSFMKPKS